MAINQKVAFFWINIISSKKALDAHQGMRGSMIGVQIKISEWSVIRSLNLRENFGLTPTIFYV